MNNSETKRAVVLLSGGMDSVTCLAIARDEEYDVFSLAFDYGQRHRRELDLAAEQSKTFGARDHKVIKMNLSAIATCALTDLTKAVPKTEKIEGIPATYVPARNTVFLSCGLAWAEVLSAQHIFIGVNQLDFSGYPDCRQEYIAAYEKMANLATKAAVEGLRIKIQTPLLNMNKVEIIQKGLALGVDYGRTHTCYDPTDAGLACGACPACRLRLHAFAQLQMDDPLGYE